MTATLAEPLVDEAAETSPGWALIQRVQSGDKAAFGALYERYSNPVFRFIYFRVKSVPLAEDLTADTFVRALGRIGSFTWQGRDPGAWLVTIARNLVADHFKSGRHRLEITADVSAADIHDEPMWTGDSRTAGDPELEAIAYLTGRVLWAAVQQLTAEQRECIVLRFLHGFSVAETARAMGRQEGAVKALQYRAVHALVRDCPNLAVTG